MATNNGDNAGGVRARCLRETSSYFKGTINLASKGGVHSGAKTTTQNQVTAALKLKRLVEASQESDTEARLNSRNSQRVRSCDEATKKLWRIQSFGLESACIAFCPYQESKSQD
jgi:hypothetical protein